MPEKKQSTSESAVSRSMSSRAFDIEKTSLKIIEHEIGTHSYDKEFEWPIVRRVIHATADFDFANKEKILFLNNAIRSGFQALANGCNIVTDVDMVKSGISKTSLSKLGLKSFCKISDNTVINESTKLNKTRSEIAMRMSAKEMDGGIVVIGNAPTALYEIIKMIKEGVTKPNLVIGIPVGFVSALESKSDLSKTDIPSITNVGRKGGSSVASSIINALMLLYIHHLT